MSKLIGLYPSGWRQRYGDELEAILVARPPTVRDRIDLARGALDARFHPQVEGPTRIRDDRGYAPLIGFALLILAVIVGANGPVMRDDYGTYTDGAAALPLSVLAVVLLGIGLYAIVERLPREQGAAQAAGVIGILVGLFWSLMPWVTLLGLTFLVTLIVAVVGARRAGLLPAFVVVMIVAAVAVPAGIMVATQFLPWYAIRVSGLNMLVVIGPLALVWPIVGAALLRGLPPAPAPAGISR
jgi:hypothetical protein